MIFTLKSNIFYYLCALKTKKGILLNFFTKNTVLLAVLLISSVIAAKAQSYSDTLSVAVYFPCGSSNIACYPNNLYSVGRFINQIDSVGQIYTVSPVSLLLTSSTSPEGGRAANRILSRHRGQTLLDYLYDNYESFRAIASSTKHRFEEITTNHLLNKMPPAEYPATRFARVTLLIKGESKDTLTVTGQPGATGDSIAYYPIEPEKPMDEKHEADAVQQTVAETFNNTSYSPILFVKTNLLYDLLSWINVSVEVPITKRLTAEATLVYPWWRSTAKHKTVQMRYVAVTPRYYFKDTDIPYTSFFAGLTVGTGTYDLQWTLRGVQGTLWHISPTIGFSHSIAKRWKLEYSASIGFIQTKYNKYTQTADTQYGDIKVKDYPWVKKVLNTVLPTSLNVSLVYTLGKIK